MKIPQELIDEFRAKLARAMWLEYGRNDAERWKNYNAELERQAEKRKRRAEQKRQYGHYHRDNIKREAFRRYSSGGIIKCARCGFDDIRALGLYPSDKDGQEPTHGGWNLYEWLKKQNWPKGYRVLCMNCVFIERGRGPFYPLNMEVFSHHSLWEDSQIKYKCSKCRHVTFVPDMVKCPKCNTPLLGQIHCVKCKFSDIRTLSLDRVEGGGRKHMEEGL